MTDATKSYIIPSSIRRSFIELAPFSKRIDREKPGILEMIQHELLERLDAGAVIPETHGLRKLRMPDPGRRKGRRGGFRVVYLDVPSLGRTYLVALYDKGEKGDISGDEKRMLRRLVDELRREAKKNAQDTAGAGAHRRAQGSH